MLKLLCLLFLIVPWTVLGQLKVGFYTPTCPQAEKIIQQVVAKNHALDGFVTPGLLRMHFHDCFVMGCDASLLIDSSPDIKSEKAAGPNFTVRHYEVIDEAKSALELECPGIVSCADIISVATRDAIALSGGPKFAIPTGRRDGFSSSPENVNLPGPSSTVQEASSIFLEKGLSLEDMVVLLGAHTVGISHCMFFMDRITGDVDPTLDPATAAQLAKICGDGSSDKPSAFLDQNTTMEFDNEYYHQLLQKRGVLKIDQNLEQDPSSKPIVTELANDPASFSRKFGEAFVKLSGIDCLTDRQGEIRRNCRVFNDPSAANAVAAAEENAEGIAVEAAKADAGGDAADDAGAAAAAGAAGDAAAAVGTAAGGDPGTAAGGDPQPATRKLRSDLGAETGLMGIS